MSTLQSVFKALQFATVKHASQRRKNPEVPYIIHPITVTKILIDAGVEDQAILSAALLHDTVEDTQTTFEELEGMNISLELLF